MRETARLQLEGRFRLGRRDRLTGEIEWGPFRRNTITTAGLGDLLDLAIGAHSNRYIDTKATITLHSAADGGGSVLFTSTTQVATYPQVAESGTGTYAAKVTWQWEDVSVNEYTPYSVTFKRDGAGFNFSLLNVNGTSEPEWGSKTDRYNWIFTYELKIDGSINVFGNGAAWYLGLYRIALLMIDAEPPFDTYTRLKVENEAKTADDTFYPTSGPTRDGTTVSWVFTAGTAFANYDWYHRTISCAGDPILRVVSDDSLGTKSNNEIWYYTYSLTASSGA